MRVADPSKLEYATLAELMPRAEALTEAGFGGLATYSKKVFIPLTRLCRDVCHYCTFATTPRHVVPYLTIDETIEIARAGVAAGCREALFTLGDQPELRYPTARRALDAMGYATTLEYLEAAAAAVHRETGLLPHLNPGLMDDAAIARLRKVSVSMGIMLESGAERLTERGGPHHGSPDKHPAARLATLEALGRAQVPTTTGLLIGIGETRAERIDSLMAIRALHERHGHIQEVILQNFCAKPDTKMANAPEPDLAEHLWTIAAARLIFGPGMSLQAPPNLRPGVLGELLRAGINDWGGVSPVTPDHVNPEAPWPELARLDAETAEAGRTLRARLAIGPAFAQDVERWVDPAMRPSVRHAADAQGLARENGWHVGTGAAAPTLIPAPRAARPLAAVANALARVRDGQRLDEAQVTALFAGGMADHEAIVEAADRARRATVGDTITYVVNRNINYTNICLYRCGFCAFSKGSTKSERGPAYRLDYHEVGRRAAEAITLGASEVCLQGGIHPDYDGDTYLGVVAAVKSAAPSIHVHAFSPLEVTHGARTLNLSLRDYLARLKAEGLSSLPGTAAEILDDEIRAIICPDKLTTQEWFDVMRAAHDVGLRSTATIMFGHVEQPKHWARHLLRVRDLQEETGGFTEFVPLPFVHMEAPIWRKGLARSGPTFNESVRMHAVARLVLGPVITNIQTSWVKMGPQGAAACLQAGANDFGGTLIDESITRAAGGRNGQHFGAEDMRKVASSIGRPLRERTTFYGQRPGVAALADA